MPHCEGTTRHHSVTVGERGQNTNTKCLPIHLLWHLNVSSGYFKEYHSTWPKKTYVRGTLSESIICYIYIALFWVLKALYIEGGESPHPPPMCSIHLDDATAAIVRQNAHHTPAYWWRGDKVMKPISVWGWLGGHDGQRSMDKFGQDAGAAPLLLEVNWLYFFFLIGRTKRCVPEYTAELR